MKIIVAGGTGFIGQFIVNHYLNQQHQVTVIGRSLAKINKIFGARVIAKDWNTIRQTGIEYLSNKDLIINLAGSGIADQSWNKSRKQEIINSRVTPTELLAKLCSRLKESSPPLFNASAIGIYGTQDNVANNLPPALTENSTISYAKHEFAQQVVKRWESATERATNADVRVLHLRFGVVLGKNGGALARLRWLYQLGLGGKVGSGQQPFSWIALPDLMRAIDFLFSNDSIQGAVNLTSPNCVTQKQFAKTMGEILKRPTFLSTPAFMLRKLYGQMADELLLNGQNVYPEVLLNQGFIFEMPELAQALKYAL